MDVEEQSVGGAPREASPPVRVEVCGAIAVIRMAQPERRNALSPEMRAGLEAAITAAQQDAGVDGIVLAGGAEAFCSGGDVGTMGQITTEAAVERVRSVHRLPRLLHDGVKPVVAAVEGACAGAGLSLAAVCDLVVAGEQARFRTAFERVGLMPDLGAGWSVTARMGAQAARRLFLLGGTLSAREANEAGLADFCVPAGEAEARALGLARHMARCAPGTRQAVRRMYRNPPRTIEEALQLESEMQPALYCSADLAEGIRAWRERREPVWSGR